MSAIGSPAECDRWAGSSNIYGVSNSQDVKVRLQFVFCVCANDHSQPNESVSLSFAPSKDPVVRSVLSEPLPGEAPHGQRGVSARVSLALSPF